MVYERIKIGKKIYIRMKDPFNRNVLIPVNQLTKGVDRFKEKMELVFSNSGRESWGLKRKKKRGK